MKRWWCFFLLACVPAAVAETPGGSTRALTLPQCIELAIQHNFDVKIEQVGIAVARHRLGEGYGIFDPELRGSAVRGNSLSPGGIDDQNRPYSGTKTHQDSFSGRVVGLLPSGLTYDFGGDIDDANGTAPDGPFENSGGGLALRLRQPLLRNSWIDERRLYIQTSRQRLKISELAWRGQVMETVTRVEVTFYDLLLARESVKVQEQALRLAEELLSANRARIAQGVLAALDEKQAEAQVSAQRALLLIAQQNVRVQENLLIGLLSDNLAEWADTTLQPAGELSATPASPQRSESWQRGLASRPDVLQAREELTRLGYVVSFNRNQLLPQLDVVGAYGQSGSDRELHGAFDQIGRGSSPFHSYGLQLSVPLTRHGPREGLKATKAEREQSNLRLKQLEQQAMLQIDDAIQAVDTDFSRVATTRQAREFAEAALQAEQTKMDNGKSTSFVVLQLQRDLTSARSEEIRALAEYNKALALLAFREGSVLERHQITLETK